MTTNITTHKETKIIMRYTLTYILLSGVPENINAKIRRIPVVSQLFYTSSFSAHAKYILAELHPKNSHKTHYNLLQKNSNYFKLFYSEFEIYLRNIPQKK